MPSYPRPADRKFCPKRQLLLLTEILAYQIRYWFPSGKLGKAEWKPSNQPSGRKADKQHNSTQEVLNGRLVSKETMIPRRCGSETLKFAIKQVNEGQISTVTETYNEVAVSSLTVKI